jgi:hypothetical protein
MVTKMSATTTNKKEIDFSILKEGCRAATAKKEANN